MVISKPSKTSPSTLLSLMKEKMKPVCMIC